MRKRVTKRIGYNITILVLSILIAISFLQINQNLCGLVNAATSSDPWALNLQIQKTGQTNTATNFAPFDQIQVSANVTYANATVPNTLVAFKITNPSATNSANITRIVPTNDAGSATFSFRLPLENQNMNSSWQASATIQTSNGTLQKNLAFAVEWNLDITSITLLDSQGKNQTSFCQGSTITVGLTINNKGQTEASNITLNFQDSQGTTINQTIVQNKQIDPNSTQIQADIQIPENATIGTAMVDAALFSGVYQNVNIPIAENKTAAFAITGSNTTLTPTLSPTISPSTKPSAKPQPIENTISLFSWLLIATGLFTFTSLFLFLKRKTTQKINTQVPSMPLESTTSSLATSSFVQTTAQEIAQKSQPATASEKTYQPTLTQQTITKIDSTFDLNSTMAEEPEFQSILTSLNRVSSAAKRIQALKLVLKLEREQLDLELAEFSKKEDDQEAMFAKDLTAVKEEIRNLRTLLTEKEGKTPQNDKNS